MAEGVVDEQQNLTKLAALWLRIDGLLDRSVMAAKHMAGLITTMENRGPPDYEQPRITVNYGDSTERFYPPSRDPSWQNSLLGKIVAPLIVMGIPAILATLWVINTNVSDLRGDQKVIVQRLDAQDAHLKATDAEVQEIKRELWNRH
jgi:hypothetical protein